MLRADCDMNGFLLYGIALGGVVVIIYLGLSVFCTQKPVVGHAIEMLITSVGAVGGFKICRYAVTGELTTALRTISAMSPEDVVYFFVGGFALLWISVETIVRRIYELYVNRPNKFV